MRFLTIKEDRKLQYWLNWRLILLLVCLLAVLALLALQPPWLRDGSRAALPAPAAAAATAAASSAPGPQVSQIQCNDTKRPTEASQQPLPPKTSTFVAVGYDLPTECEKHALLFPAAFDSLRPWFKRGITQRDLDACAPIAAGHPDAYEEGTPGWMRFRLLLHNNQVFITSGGLRRGSDDPHTYEGLEYYQIKQIQDAAQRFGLPNMEFAVGFGDLAQVKGEEHGGLCPLMLYCKDPADYDILIPDGDFTKYMYDAWLARNRKDGYGPPWEEKDERAVGSHGDELTSISGEELMPLSAQRAFKYTLHTDGLGCSTRLQKVMATGQAVLKQDSRLQSFFYAALRPWVHYVPVGWNGVEEVEWAVQLLRDNDDLARTLGANARDFAHTHLTEEGRACYIKVLFEEMRKLMRYEMPPLSSFPNAISYDVEVQRYVDSMPNNMGLVDID